MPDSANPNRAVNGWCATCEEWAVRGRQNQCMFCDTPLLNEPAAEEALPAAATAGQRETSSTDERSLPMGGNGNGGTRTGDAILSGALAELYERKRQIEPMLAELDDVNKAIKTLEKAAGKPAPRASGGGARQREVPDELREKVVTAVAAAPDALSVDAIADRIGTGKGPYLYSMLRQLEERGDLVRIDGDYAAPAAPVT